MFPFCHVKGISNFPINIVSDNCNISLPGFSDRYSKTVQTRYFTPRTWQSSWYLSSVKSRERDAMEPDTTHT